MSRSLSWIDNSSFDARLSELARPVASNGRSEPGQISASHELASGDRTAGQTAPRTRKPTAPRSSSHVPSSRDPTDTSAIEWDREPTVVPEHPAAIDRNVGERQAPNPGLHQRPARRRRPGGAAKVPDDTDVGAKPIPGRSAERREYPLPRSGVQPDVQAGSSRAPRYGKAPPWQMTPAQPWSALAGPPDVNADGADIPALVYPVGMGISPRLELFRAWIRKHCSTGAFFVSDHEGLPLLLEGMGTSQAVSAVAFDRAVHPLRGLLGTRHANSLCIELEDGRLVQTVWANTNTGRIAVGISPARPLGPAATERVRKALQGLFSDGEA